MRKLKNKKGFTMIEMLVCVVTLMLLCMIVTTGSNLATMSMNASLFESESQMLKATLDLSLGDMLRHATDVVLENDGKTVKSFCNSAYYIDNGKIKVDTKDSGITDAGYLICTSDTDGSSRGLLVANKGIYVKEMYVTDFKLSYDKDTHVFSGSYVIVSKLTTATKKCEFSFRSIADLNN